MEKKRACCAGSSGRGAFGCDDVPIRIGTCTCGATIFVSFFCPWCTDFAVIGTVSIAISYTPGVGETIVLRFH